MIHHIFPIVSTLLFPSIVDSSPIMHNGHIAARVVYADGSVGITGGGCEGCSPHYSSIELSREVPGNVLIGWLFTNNGNIDGACEELPPNDCRQIWSCSIRLTLHMTFIAPQGWSMILSIVNPSTYINQYGTGNHQLSLNYDPRCGYTHPIQYRMTITDGCNVRGEVTFQSLTGCTKCRV